MTSGTTMQPRGIFSFLWKNKDSNIVAPVCTQRKKRRKSGLSPQIIEIEKLIDQTIDEYVGTDPRRVTRRKRLDERYQSLRTLNNHLIKLQQFRILIKNSTSKKSRKRINRKMRAYFQKRHG